jgi:hypothetical protein
MLPPHSLALLVVVAAGIASLFNIALAWKAGPGAIRFALLLGLSLVLIVIALTLIIPGAWAT